MLSLLTSYEFIKAHLAHHTHLLAQEPKLLLYPRGGRSSRFLFNLILHLGGNRLRKLEFLDEEVFELVGSCNGLVLVDTVSYALCLINCLTQEFVKVPDLPSGFARIFGFGYDSLSDDYKIVSLSCKDDNDNADAFVDIYSLKMRSCRRFGTLPYGLNTLGGDSGVLLNGALHWTRSSNIDSCVIVAFDLSSETFNEIPAPASIDMDISKFPINKLMVIDGCLGIAVELFTDIFAEIWVMKSYSMVESWTRLVIDMEFADYWYPHCFHKGKLLFSEADGEILKWYHLQDGRVDVCLVNDEDASYFGNAITYSESLVSPHFNYHS